MVVSCSRDKTVIVWGIAQGIPIKTLKGHTDWVSGVVDVALSRRPLFINFEMK